ncbi:hypothetical protein [Flavihumibacter petaseus]|uniref:Uncharacterized protein n=1 Tax=Flavihumibacter petaseus NBRC 106054 TaxID=1220578 RepID=A0A0E9N2F1_9BACT|nr:hypothetical protein [Flavihumibacter petaseus]GAO43963.1 hypothetical protein FPE01S_03_00020 [Flavihumibacter petaseus NBRC 106054]
MEQVTAYAPTIPFGAGAIESQMQRIFEHPHFMESGILKKFLSFIVHETLSGNSACLKEYTIAVKVLEKPVNFNPQQNCIVRIHAGRLRRALNQYYAESGSEDQIMISIPKGKYIPEFNDRWSSTGRVVAANGTRSFGDADDRQLSVAILPFLCAAADDLQKAFADNVCLQISAALMQVDEISVIAYPAVKSLTQKYPDYRELGASIGFNYILTGGMQFSREKIRVNMQLIECRTYKQIWSELYECKPDPDKTFETQDDITNCAVTRLKEYVFSVHPSLPVFAAQII